MRKKKRDQGAKGIVPESRFSERGLTSRAGLIMVARFARKLGLARVIDETVHVKRGTNIRYTLGMIVSSVTLGIVSGCRHISHLCELGADEVFMKTQGWESFPVVSAITRVLERFRMVQCVEFARVQRILRQKVWNKKWFGVVHLDLDSSAKSAYGHQQGVARGHNTERSHKPMLNPLFAFIAQTGECLNCWLRPGNTHSANGSVEFLRETLAQLPKRVWKVIVRADSAFFSIEFLRELHRRCCGYVVKVKIRGWRDLCAAQVWQKAHGQEGVWTAEFFHKLPGWKTARRFVAVRRLVGMETEGTLFPIPKYSYSLWVTNLSLTPLQIERFYNKRSVAENLIGAGKNQMAFGSMLVEEFWANHALLQAAVLAYNLLIWFQRLVTDSRRWKERPNTLRVWFIFVAARLLKTNSSWALALSESYPYKQEWKRVEERLGALTV
jgi:Transposase DDE domain group 1